jgi:hypothetical protein
MQEILNLPKNAKLELIAEKGQRTLMVKVNAGLVITVLLTLQNHFLPILASFLKDSVMKNRSRVVLAHIRIHMVILSVNIAQEGLNVLISK